MDECAMGRWSLVRSWGCCGRCIVGADPIVPNPPGAPVPNPVPNCDCVPGAPLTLLLPRKLCVDAGVKLKDGVLAGAAPPNIDGVLAAPNSGLLAAGAPNGVLCGAAPKGLAVAPGALCCCCCCCWPNSVVPVFCVCPNRPLVDGWLEPNENAIVNVCRGLSVLRIPWDVWGEGVVVTSLVRVPN